MQDIDVYEKLKKYPEYIDFRKKNRIRAIVAASILCLCWLILFDVEHLNVSENMRVLALGILICVTFFGLRFLVRVLILKPAVILETQIIAVREKRRTVEEDDRLRTRLTHEYGVGQDKVQYWADCIMDFNCGREKKHNIGESVYFFSIGPGNNYIISK